MSRCASLIYLVSVAPQAKHAEPVDNFPYLNRCQDVAGPMLEITFYHPVHSEPEALGRDQTTVSHLNR
jgi:hypothetical protein